MSWISPSNGPTPFADIAADVDRRQREFGPLRAPRNDGTRRTESKKALLRAIEAAGGKW